MCALPIDDLPTLRYFLLGHSIWPKATKESPRLFASLEEAQMAASAMAEAGEYSEFALYLIERGRLRRVSSAAVRYGSSKLVLDWRPEADRPLRR